MVTIGFAFTSQKDDFPLCAIMGYGGSKEAFILRSSGLQNFIGKFSCYCKILAAVNLFLKGNR